MPSCDGSNCGACACNCDCSIRETNVDYKSESERLQKLVEQLQKDISKKDKIIGNMRRDVFKKLFGEE